MALEALSSNELFNFIIYDTISAIPPCSINDSIMSPSNFSQLGNSSTIVAHRNQDISAVSCGSQIQESRLILTNKVDEAAVGIRRHQITNSEGRKKRKRKPRVCKNKEEAETQRMTHIAVERNRRKQMNEHLAGDQASIVGGAIEFVKELEHLLQSLEAQKLKLLQQGLTITSTSPNNDEIKIMPPPFQQFFVYPQYTCWTHIPNNYRSSSSAKHAAAIADIEVTLVDTHANLRILSRKCFRQLPKLVSAFQSLYLSILHLGVTTLDPLALYSINAKVEEGCQLTSVDDIANAVHHMLVIIEDEASTVSLIH
ncbi:hypothetical protein ACFE04_015004 [Oxalis oulophora]